MEIEDACLMNLVKIRESAGKGQLFFRDIYSLVRDWVRLRVFGNVKQSMPGCLAPHYLTYLPTHFVLSLA